MKTINNPQKEFIQLLENTPPIDELIIIEKPNAKYVYHTDLTKMLVKNAKRLVNIDSNRIPKSYLAESYQNAYVWCTRQTKETLQEYLKKIKKYIAIENELRDLWKVYSSHETEMTWKEYENKDKSLTYDLRKIDLPVGCSSYLLDLIESKLLNK